MLFKKRVKGNIEIHSKVLRRLGSISDGELIRWIDNLHTSLGQNVSEIRKSLTSNNQDQALIYVEDTRNGAVSLLAAIQVLEERLTH